MNLLDRIMTKLGYRRTHWTDETLESLMEKTDISPTKKFDYIVYRNGKRYTVKSSVKKVKDRFKKSAYSFKVWWVTKDGTTVPFSDAHTLSVKKMKGGEKYD